LKLPYRANATIKPEKISGYLLSSSHTAGRHKARFFERFGFSSSAPEVFRASIIEHAGANDVATVDESRFGTRYAVDGALESPDGRNPSARVIWFVEAGGDTPQFVTAYPLPKGKT
jgi:hypothetical protein